MALPLDMTGKLYWRYKKNGKWTWRPASLQFLESIKHVTDMYGIQEEE
jgi:hypothetical protein